MKSKGATKEAPIYAVPMHVPQTSSLWRKLDRDKNVFLNDYIQELHRKELWDQAERCARTQRIGLHNDQLKVGTSKKKRSCD
jgi:hypothetical protein